MGRGPFHALSSVLLAASMLLCQPGTAASDLSDQEIRGRALFLTGRTDEPAPYAAVGAGNVQLPATAVPCGSCHGRDGLGGAERGGWPPNITWPVLSAPDVTPGRTRPPYSETLVVRAVTMGIDAGGNRLDPVMPRFHLSMADAAALLAYIKRLGTLPEPGLDDHSLVLGTVLGPHDAAVGLALSAYLAKVNQDGGLFGRHLVLNVERPAPGEPLGRGIGRLTKSATIFALLAPAIAGDESNAVAAVDTYGVPMIGPSTPSTANSTAQSLRFLSERRRGGRGAGARRLRRHLARLAVDRRRSHGSLACGCACRSGEVVGRQQAAGTTPPR